MQPSEKFQGSDEPGPGHYKVTNRDWFNSNSVGAVKYNGKKLTGTIRTKSTGSCTFKSKTDRTISA